MLSSSWVLTDRSRSLCDLATNDNNDGIGKNWRNFSLMAGYNVSSSGYMRGTVFWESNKPFTIEEFHMPRPKVGELLIKTKSCKLWSVPF
ncbi:hypothetical protein SLEP1_g25592 [Rubroshorea leprosula]|uniref:Uncharacterized protein n=1 Tax=Rubroshorea leprosula TaxID=152421 RepID=A0AAV5JMH5_9ROSI|nr:hypothetical protein SLEP1_g25592 [Rubroshorea leprosula]